MGSALITETLERRPELGFASYDRMFPSQDTMPKGGFGNLIALPLQRRARDYGNSVFVDNKLLPVLCAPENKHCSAFGARHDA